MRTIKFRGKIVIDIEPFAMKKGHWVEGYYYEDLQDGEWLKKNIDLYAYESSNTHYPEIKLTECFETAFRQAMKGGTE